MLQHSLYVLLIFIASAFASNKLSPQIPHVFDSTNYSMALFEPDLSPREYNSSGELYDTPLRGSILQSQEQMFTYSVNMSTGVGEDYMPLIFLTGNICSQPSDLSTSANKSLTVYVSFNESAMTSLEYASMYHYEQGYFSALTNAEANGETTILYILVQAPQSTNIYDTWSYEIGVSQDDLMHQWDSHPYVAVTDTDSSSALITTQNLTARESAQLSDFNASISSYDLLVFDYSYKEQMASLNNSWCAVKHGPYLFSASDFYTSYTMRGGGLHQQFYVSGLNASTKYLGVLLQDRNAEKSGGLVYKPFEFETESSQACSLIYDLDFCDQVAYSVPASSLEEISDRATLKQVYDDRARSLFTNFSKSLQQIVCNTTKDAIFSPLGSCEACNTSYKNWLCSVTIPRCSSRNITGYLHRSNNNSRNSFINDNIRPPLDYYEVLPCLNVCHILVRDCPAAFGFACPSTNATIATSYFWDEDGAYDTCNFVGEVAQKTSKAQMVHVTWTVLLFGMSAAMFF